MLNFASWTCCVHHTQIPIKMQLLSSIRAVGTFLFLADNQTLVGVCVFNLYSAHKLLLHLNLPTNDYYGSPKRLVKKNKSVIDFLSPIDIVFSPLFMTYTDFVMKFNIWHKVLLSVCSTNIKIDSPKLHASVTKGRCLNFSSPFTWIESYKLKYAPLDKSGSDTSTHCPKDLCSCVPCRQNLA